MIAPNLIPTLQGAAFDRALALARLKAKLATITGRGFALPVIDPR